MTHAKAVQTRRLLLVTHRSLDQAGGATARWRSMLVHLPELGWQIDVVSAPERATSAELTSDPARRRRIARRAGLMSGARRFTAPIFAPAGIQPPPLSTLWAPRGTLDSRRALAGPGHDVVVASAPPMVALVAARAAVARSDVPLVVDLRDLWAGNPAYDAGGELLTRVEAWVLRRACAIIACTPEAAEDLSTRHETLSSRVHVVTNGYEHGLPARRREQTGDWPRMLEIVHSGALTEHRPLTPLLDVLGRERYRSRFHLTLHGYTAPKIVQQVRRAADRCEIDVAPPSSWEEAIRRISSADIGLVTQATGAGDDTAVASKVYEYLALGKPVLCLSDGGATEGLLRRIGADRWCGRLNDPSSIAAALDRLLDQPDPAPVPPAVLGVYDRLALASRMAELLEDVACGSPIRRIRARSTATSPTIS